MTIHPRPSESLIPNTVMQNVECGSPPPIRVCPSLSWPTVLLSPFDAVSPKQEAEFVHGKGLDFAMPSRMNTLPRKSSWSFHYSCKTVDRRKKIRTIVAWARLSGFGNGMCRTNHWVELYEDLTELSPSCWHLQAKRQRGKILFSDQICSSLEAEPTELRPPIESILERAFPARKKVFVCIRLSSTLYLRAQTLLHTKTLCRRR